MNVHTDSHRDCISSFARFCEEKWRFGYRGIHKLLALFEALRVHLQNKIPQVSFKSTTANFRGSCSTDNNQAAGSGWIASD